MAAAGDFRRRGDVRPFEQPGPLTFLPTSSRPFRWLPRHGEPYCVAEWMSQRFVRSLAYLPVYTAFLITLVLLIQLFGSPRGR